MHLRLVCATADHLPRFRRLCLVCQEICAFAAAARLSKRSGDPLRKADRELRQHLPQRGIRTVYFRCTSQVTRYSIFSCASSLGNSAFPLVT